MKTRAFTLIELLVTIGLFSLLAVLLLPVIGKILEKNRAAKCANNLRQIFTAVQAFTNDKGGRIMRNTGEDNYILWSDTLVGDGYIPGDFYKYGITGERPTGVFACPSSKAVCYGGARADYAMNFFVNGEILPDGSNGNFRMASLSHPAKVVALIDGVLPAGTCNRSVAPWLDAETWGIAFRHNGRANVTFFDGHVELLSKKDLRLQQSQAWEKLPWSPTAQE